MFNWRQYPDLDKKLLSSVEEALNAGRSKASCFKEFSTYVSSQVGVTVTSKACEVRYMRLTGQIPKYVQPRKSDEEEGHTPRNSAWREAAVEKVVRLVSNGSTVRAACAKVATEVKRKSRTVRNAYEEWKKEQKKSNQAPAALPAKSSVSPLGTVTMTTGMAFEGDRNEEDVLFEAIGKLCEFGPKIKEFDLATFANGLSALVRSATLPVVVAQEAEQVAGLREQVLLLQKEVTRLQLELAVAQASEEKLRRDNVALRSEVQEVRKEYTRYYKEMVARWQDVEEVCNYHLSQSLGERVSVMRPFGERLRLTVDRFGVVIASAPEVLQERDGMFGGSTVPVLETRR